MKKLTLDKVVEYVLILAITMVLVLIGNCINTITDGNPDTFVSVLDGIPGMLILFGIALVSLCIAQYTPKIPAIIYITIFGILLAMPYNTVTGRVCSRTGGKDRTSSGSLSGTGICRCVYQ